MKNNKLFLTMTIILASLITIIGNINDVWELIEKCIDAYKKYDIVKQIAIPVVFISLIALIVYYIFKNKGEHNENGILKDIKMTPRYVLTSSKCYVQYMDAIIPKEKSPTGTKDLYTVKIIVDKSDKKTIKAINTAKKEAVTEFNSKYCTNIDVNIFDACIDDQGEKLLLISKSTNKPILLDKDNNIINGEGIDWNKVKKGNYLDNFHGRAILEFSIDRYKSGYYANIKHLKIQHG